MKIGRQKRVCIIVDCFDNLSTSSTLLANGNNGGSCRHQQTGGGLRGIHAFVSSGIDGYRCFCCFVRWPSSRLSRDKVCRWESAPAGPPKVSTKGSASAGPFVFWGILRKIGSGALYHRCRALRCKAFQAPGGPRFWVDEAAQRNWGSRA